MSRATISILIALTVLILSVTGLLGQSSAKTPGPAFEVASVKPNTSGEARSRIGIRPGGRMIATNATLKNLVMQAYQVKEFQVSGGPGWVDSDRFDVNAVASENVGPEQVLLMLQSLLEERFQLKIRRTSKDGDVLVLRVAGGGSKLRPVSGDGSNQGVQMELRHLYSNPVAPISAFASALSNVMGRTVIDRTDLQGLYKIDLTWGKSEKDEAGPAITTAIQEQLGLQLASEKLPTDVIVIESATRLKP